MLFLRRKNFIVSQNSGPEALIIFVKKCLSPFAPAEDRTRDPPHKNPTLYRVAIKAGLYRKAVQVCYISNTTTFRHQGVTLDSSLMVHKPESGETIEKLEA